jgi:hypothetical protein
MNQTTTNTQEQNMITVKRFTDGRPQTKKFQTEEAARTWMGDVDTFTVEGKTFIDPAQGSKWFYNTKYFEMVGV